MHISDLSRGDVSHVTSIYPVSDDANAFSENITARSYVLVPTHEALLMLYNEVLVSRHLGP